MTLEEARDLVLSKSHPLNRAHAQRLRAAEHALISASPDTRAALFHGQSLPRWLARAVAK